MLDLILDILGVALFLGQAVYFLFAAGDQSIPVASERSILDIGRDRADA